MKTTTTTTTYDVDNEDYDYDGVWQKKTLMPQATSQDTSTCKSVS